MQVPPRPRGRPGQRDSATLDVWGPASLRSTVADEGAAAGAASRMSLASSVATASASALTLAARRASTFIPRPRTHIGRQPEMSPRQSLAQVDPSNQWGLLSALLDVSPAGEDPVAADGVPTVEILSDDSEDEEEESLGSSTPPGTVPLPDQVEHDDRPQRMLSPPVVGQEDVFFADPDLLPPQAPAAASPRASFGSPHLCTMTTPTGSEQPLLEPSWPPSVSTSTDQVRFSRVQSPEERRSSCYFSQPHGGALAPEAPLRRRSPLKGQRSGQRNSVHRLSRGKSTFSQYLPSAIPPIPIGVDPITFVASQATIPPSPATTPAIPATPTVPSSTHPSLRAPASRLLLAHADEDADRLLIEKESSPAQTLPFWERYLYPHKALARNIAKCTLAYFLASMFTFSPVLSEFMAHWLPHRDSDRRAPIANLHMVATVSVYFHAARTLGGMVLANGYALLGLTVVTLWCVASMTIAETLHELGHPNLSNTLVLAFFIGVGVGVGSWSKTQPHLQPAVWNTTGTMGSILLFVVLVKEGSPHLGRFNEDKVVQVAACCIVGTFISSAVCLGLWPESATTRLQSGVKKDLDAFARLLRAITTVFLLDENESPFMGKNASGASSAQRALVGAIGRHGSSFTRAQTETEEACLESWIDPRMSSANVRQAYRGVAQSLTRLAQHLAALRAPCNAPSHISLRTARAGGFTGALNTPSSCITPGSTETAKLPPLFEGQVPGSQEPASFAAATSVLGPDIRSLAFTCSRTLLALKDAFSPGDCAQEEEEDADDQDPTTCTYGATLSGSAVYKHGMPLSWLRADLSAAIQRFALAQTQFNARMTQEWIGRTPKFSAAPGPGESTGANSASTAAYLDAAGTAQGEDAVQEDTYLVVFFAWTLSEFAAELKRLIPHLEVVRMHEANLANAQRQFNQSGDRPATPWAWAWHFVRRFAIAVSWPLILFVGFLTSVLKVAWSSLYSLFRRVRQDAIPTGQFDPSGRPSRRNESDTPGYMSHYPGTLQTPLRHDEGWRSRWADRVWRASRWFRRPNVRFAIKAGGGAAILALPAFIKRTRPLFEMIQGQWALVSFFVVMSPTVGQSTYMGLQRTAGTIIGALAATVAYNIFPDDNVGLTLFGLLFVVPCFYVIVATPARASSARLVLLAYNLTALYSYNLRKTGTEVEEIAIFRTLSVLIGVAWAAFLSAFVWPMEARRLLVQGTSDLLFNLAWLYQAIAVRAVSSSTKTPAVHYHDPAADFFGSQGELALLAQHRRPGRTLSVPPTPTSADDAIASMTLSIQVALIWLEGLLPHTSTELRLKGPFPKEAYLHILSLAQGFLDALHGLSAVAQVTTDAARNGLAAAPTVPSNLNPNSASTHVKPADTVQDALALELTGHTVLVLYLLAASFRLRTPLPPYMPRVEAARQKLLVFHPTQVSPGSAPAPPGYQAGPPSPKHTRRPHVKVYSTEASPSTAPTIGSQPSLAVRSPSLSVATQRTIRLYSYALGMKEVSRHLELLVDVTQRTLGVVGGGSLVLPP